MKGNSEEELVAHCVAQGLTQLIRAGTSGTWLVQADSRWINIGRSLAERVHIAAQLKAALPPDPCWNRSRHQLSTPHGRHSFWAEYRWWCVQHWQELQISAPEPATPKQPAPEPPQDPNFPSATTPAS